MTRRWNRNGWQKQSGEGKGAWTVELRARRAAADQNSASAHPGITTRPPPAAVERELVTELLPDRNFPLGPADQRKISP